MTTNEKLYGKGVVVPPIPRGIADERIKLLSANMRVLLSVHFMEQDNDAIREVTEAMKFWDRLRRGEGI